MQRKCEVEGCAEDHWGKGFCRKHFLRWRKYGSPHTLQRPPRGERGQEGLAFIERALASDTDECIDWPHGANDNGYGTVVEKPRTKSRSVPALVCERKHGKKPTPDHQSAHSCGRRICINWKHLRWATHQENMDDAVRHGTIPRGEKHVHAKLTETAVHEIRR